jgi:hypothetical protein
MRLLYLAIVFACVFYGRHVESLNGEDAAGVGQTWVGEVLDWPGKNIKVIS